MRTPYIWADDEFIVFKRSIAFSSWTATIARRMTGKLWLFLRVWAIAWWCISWVYQDFRWTEDLNHFWKGGVRNCGRDFVAWWTFLAAAGRVCLGSLPVPTVRRDYLRQSIQHINSRNNYAGILSYSNEIPVSRMMKQPYASKPAIRPFISCLWRSITISLNTSKPTT